MGAFWSGSQRQSESITRQKLQQSTIRELAAIEQCIYCYIDTRLGYLLGPYSKQKYPWDSPPYCNNPQHLKYNRNYQPKECCHCPKGQFRDHVSCEVLDRLYGKTTSRCQCATPSAESDISLEQHTEDESDLNENVYTNCPI